MIIYKYLTSLGSYIILMGRTFSKPERFRMFWKQYVKEMAQLGVDSIGIVLLISFFIGAVICIQMKLNIQSPWMPRWVSGYTTREIMLLEFSSSIMCLILAGKVGSNIASELGTMRVTQQIDALDIMGVNSASYLILPKITGLITMMPFLVIFSSALGILGAMSANDIRFAVFSDDYKALSRAPGVGPKTAKKLILELKDKLKLEDALGSFQQDDTGVDTASAAASEAEMNDAVQALVSLGYSSSEALRAVRKVKITEDMQTQDVLKQALKYIGI